MCIQLNIFTHNKEVNVGRETGAAYGFFYESAAVMLFGLYYIK